MNDWTGHPCISFEYQHRKIIYRSAGFQMRLMKYPRITIKNRSQSKPKKNGLMKAKKNVLMSQMIDHKSSKQINRIKITKRSIEEPESFVSSETGLSLRKIAILRRDVLQYPLLSMALDEPYCKVFQRIHVRTRDYE